MTDLISKKEVIGILNEDMIAFEREMNYIKPKGSTEDFSSTTAKIRYYEYKNAINQRQRLIDKIKAIKPTT